MTKPYHVSDEVLISAVWPVQHVCIVCVQVISGQCASSVLSCIHGKGRVLNAYVYYRVIDTHTERLQQECTISALHFADTFFCFQCFSIFMFVFSFLTFFFLVLECDWQLRGPVPLMTHDHWQLCEALNTSLASQLAYKHTQTHTRIYPVLTEVCRQTHQIGPCRCDTYTRCFSLYPISQCSKQHTHTLFCIALVYVSYQGLVFPVLQSPPRPPRKRLPLADSGTAWFLAPTLSKWGFNSEVYIHVFYVSAWIFQVSFNKP